MFDEMIVILVHCDEHDVGYDVVDGSVHVMVHGFGGFDKRWCELEHE